MNQFRVPDRIANYYDEFELSAIWSESDFKGAYCIVRRGAFVDFCKGVESAVNSSSPHFEMVQFLRKQSLINVIHNCIVRVPSITVFQTFGGSISRN